MKTQADAPIDRDQILTQLSHAMRLAGAMGTMFGQVVADQVGMNATDLQYTQDWLYSTEDFANVAPVTLDQWVDFAPVDAVLADVGTVDGDATGR